LRHQTAICLLYWFDTFLSSCFFFFFNFPIYFLSKWDPRTLRLLFHAKNPTINEKVKVPLPSPTNSIAPDPSTSSHELPWLLYYHHGRPRWTHFSSLALQSYLLLSASYLPLSAFCPDKTLLLRHHGSRIISFSIWGSSCCGQSCNLFYFCFRFDSLCTRLSPPRCLIYSWACRISSGPWEIIVVRVS